ncbi:MAG: hypothetical protein Q4A16_06010 [Lautropia sp.]|nr:hypothetical protein [Lautropia sp.]
MDSSFDVGRRPAETLDAGTLATGVARVRSGRRWLAAGALVAAGALLTDASVLADTVTRVYQSRMPDGSVVFGDKPVTGAREYSSREYRLPDPLPDDVLEAERLDWEHQARAFDQRHAERQAIEALAERVRHEAAPQRTQANTRVLSSGGVAYPAWGPQIRPVAPPAGHASQYRSSPGAINGRQNPFLGSGFSAHRVP